MGSGPGKIEYRLDRENITLFCVLRRKPNVNNFPNTFVYFVVIPLALGVK